MDTGGLAGIVGLRVGSVPEVAYGAFCASWDLILPIWKKDEISAGKFVRAALYSESGTELLLLKSSAGDSAFARRDARDMRRNAK